MLLPTLRPSGTRFVEMFFCNDISARSAEHLARKLPFFPAEPVV